jgi:hypothetical protein
MQPPYGVFSKSSGVNFREFHTSTQFVNKSLIVVRGFAMCHPLSVRGDSSKEDTLYRRATVAPTFPPVKAHRCGW